MGYAFVVGECFSCGAMFTFNPNAVPSIRVNGVKEPVCRSCIESANPIRAAKGLPEIEIRPDALRAGGRERIIVSLDKRIALL